MDHSQNDKRFYVYVHKDQKGIIRYIGSGQGDRYYNKCYRCNDHLFEWNSLSKEIIKSGLSREYAMSLEQELIKSVGIENLLNKQSIVTQARPVEYDFISKYLYYDETSPTFLRWSHTFTKGSSTRIKDEPAGCLHKSGYVTLSFLNKPFKAHRVVWVLCNKTDMPTNLVIDHIDGNKSNNNINNLRAVTCQENVKNAGVRSDNKTGKVGVSENHRGYLVTWTECGIQKSKFFSFRRIGLSYNNKEEALLLASEYRELSVRKSEGDLSTVQRLDQIDSILTIDKPISRNTSGVTGINWNRRGNAWIFRWSLSGIRESKRFSVTKLFPDLPFEEAKQKTFELAKEFRDSKLKEIFKHTA